MNGDSDRFEEWVLEAYKRRVKQADRDGIKRPDAIDDVVRIIQDDLARGDLQMPIDVRLLVQRIIEKDDSKRRKGQIEIVQLVNDCVNELTILGTDDPVLDEVCVIGDGLRKAWRFVNIENLLEMAQVKSQKAMESTIAANEFLTKVRAATSYMLREIGPDAMIGDISRS